MLLNSRRNPRLSRRLLLLHDVMAERLPIIFQHTAMKVKGLNIEIDLDTRHSPPMR